MEKVLINQRIAKLEEELKELRSTLPVITLAPKAYYPYDPPHYVAWHDKSEGKFRPYSYIDHSSTAKNIFNSPESAQEFCDKANNMLKELGAEF